MSAPAGGNSYSKSLDEAIANLHDQLCPRSSHTRKQAYQMTAETHPGSGDSARTLRERSQQIDGQSAVLRDSGLMRIRFLRECKERTYLVVGFDGLVEFILVSSIGTCKSRTFKIRTRSHKLGHSRDVWMEGRDEPSVSYGIGSGPSNSWNEEGQATTNPANIRLLYVSTSEFEGVGEAWTDLAMQYYRRTARPDLCDKQDISSEGCRAMQMWLTGDLVDLLVQRRSSNQI